MPVSAPKKTRRACKGLYEHIAEALRPLAVPIADLTQDPANARLHPPKNVEGIAASLRVYGQRKPVVVNKRTGAVEAGNGTLEAARTLGWTHIRRQVGEVLPGFQLRYIYFLDPAASDLLTVPIIPFVKITELGAGMYLGKPRAASIAGDAPGHQPGQGGSTPTAALCSD